MKIKILYSIVVLTLIKCNNEGDTILNYNHLIGGWSPCTEDNDAIIIKRNGKIQFVDGQKVLDYKLKSDTLLILEHNFLITKYKIKKLDKNILILQTENGNLIKFVKGKNKHPCGL